jgi:hypothetical protein
MNDRPVLADKEIYPSEKNIFPHIGKSRPLWLSLFEHIHANYPDFSEEWRYYNDGKSWLLKVTKKAKTIFWLAVLEGTFRTTFYFTDKANHAIARSLISDELKEQFKNGKKYNKIRGLTITFKNKKDCIFAEELIKIKLSIK